MNVCAKGECWLILESALSDRSDQVGIIGPLAIDQFLISNFCTVCYIQKPLMKYSFSNVEQGHYFLCTERLSLSLSRSLLPLWRFTITSAKEVMFSPARLLQFAGLHKTPWQF